MLNAISELNLKRLMMQWTSADILPKSDNEYILSMSTPLEQANSFVDKVLKIRSKSKVSEMLHAMEDIGLDTAALEFDNSFQAHSSKEPSNMKGIECKSGLYTVHVHGNILLYCYSFLSIDKVQLPINFHWRLVGGRGFALPNDTEWPSTSYSTCKSRL